MSEDEKVVVNESDNEEENDGGGGGGSSSSSSLMIVADLRQRGNYEFSTTKQYVSAIALYTEALNVIQMTASRSPEMQKEYTLNLCNRAACYYCMEDYENAKVDAMQAWDSSPSYDNIKAAYRIAKTTLAMGEYAAAQKIIQEAIEVIDKHAVESAGEGGEKDIAKSKQSFEDLLIQAYIGPTLKGEEPNPKSIKWAQRILSIREFQKGNELGYGNFSEIHVVTHKQTNERFALKCIVKKKAEDLAKRQHPNVHNEIAMERRVLMERLPPLCPFIVKLYHSFEDYTTIYYLMDLHESCGDLWSQLRFYQHKQNNNDNDNTNQDGTWKMVGAHPSQIQLWTLQLIDALEYMHRYGIVHRDLKPENILLNKYGDIVVIDFGTAKDLIQTDLNGPEFVGTPDFMAPEAVQGSGTMPGNDTDDENDSDQDDKDKTTKKKSRLKRKTKQKKQTLPPATTSTDLWALGAITYILHTGETPFWSPSPYLTFLKIKRCNLLRPMSIVSDDAWDFITSLMRYVPSERFCANVYEISYDNNDGKTNPKPKNIVGGYNPLRQHKYLQTGREQFQYYDQIASGTATATASSNGNVQQTATTTKKPYTLMIPSLKDLCVRKCAELLYQDSLDYKLCDQYIPGDQSSHDVTKLDYEDQQLIMHILDKRRLFSDPVSSFQLFERFIQPKNYIQEKLHKKVRIGTHDFLGLTRMNDNGYKPPSTLNEDPYAKPMKLDPYRIIHLTNPLFTDQYQTLIGEHDNETNALQRKEYVKLLKKAIASINRIRPKLVVVTGDTINATCRKLLARISDSIPIAIMDKSQSIITEENLEEKKDEEEPQKEYKFQQTFYTIWQWGIQVIVLQSKFLVKTKENSKYYKDQMIWLREHLEQCRMSKHPLFVFVDCDPRELSKKMLARLARGKVQALLGIINESKNENGGPSSMDIKYHYKFNETLKGVKEEAVAENADDDSSVNSTNSKENEKDNHTMRIFASNENAMRHILIEEQNIDWTTEYTQVE